MGDNELNLSDQEMIDVKLISPCWKSTKNNVENVENEDEIVLNGLTRGEEIEDEEKDIELNDTIPSPFEPIILNNNMSSPFEPIISNNNGNTNNNIPSPIILNNSGNINNIPSPFQPIISKNDENTNNDDILYEWLDWNKYSNYSEDVKVMCIQCIIINMF